MMKRRIPPSVSAGISLVVGAVAVAASSSRSLYAVALWAVALAVYARMRAVTAIAGTAAILIALVASKTRPPAEVAVVGAVGAILLIAAAAALIHQAVPARAAGALAARIMERRRRPRLHPLRFARSVVASAPAAGRSLGAGASASFRAARRGLLSTARLVFREQWRTTSAVLQLVMLGIGWFQPVFAATSLGSVIATVVAAISNTRAAAAAVVCGTFLAALLVAIGQRTAGEALALLPFLTLLGLLVRLAIGAVFVAGARDEPQQGSRQDIRIGSPMLLPFAVALGLLTAPMLFWNDGKYLVGGDDSLLYYVYPLRMLKHYALNIAADNNLSSVTGYGQQLYLAPFLVLLAATKTVLPGINTQLLWYSLNLAGGFLACFALLGEFRTQPGSTALGARVAAAVAYSVSVFSYFTVWGTQLFPVYLVVVYPLASLLFLRAVRLRSVPRVVSAALLLALFSIVILSTPWLLGMALVSLLPFLWVIWEQRRRALLYGGLFLVLALLLNAHWITHMVNAALVPTASLKPVNLSFGPADERLIREISVANTVLYPMLNLFHFGMLERFGSTNFPIYSRWNANFLLPNLAVFALIPLAAVRARMASSRARSLFVVSSLSWLLAVFLFTAQVGSWGVGVFLFLSRNVPGFVMFRNMYDKFGLALALASALVLFAALQLIAEARDIAPGRDARRLVAVFVSFLMVVQAGPFLLGRYYDQPLYSTERTFRTITELNHDFRDMTRALASSDASARYAWLPLNAANYVQIEDQHKPNHVYSGVSPLLFLAGKNDLSGQLSFGSFGGPLVEAVLAHDWVRVGETFQRFNVRYVIVNNQISPDLQQSYLFGVQARGDLYEAQQDPQLPLVLLGPKVQDFGRRYSVYDINPRFESQRVSVRSGDQRGERVPEAAFSKDAPHLYRVTLKNVASGDRIQFLDPFNPQWRVTYHGEAVPLAHELALDYANEWRIDLARLRSTVDTADFVDHGDGTADVRVQLSFEGQRLFRPAIATSAVTAAACLVFLLGAVIRAVLDSRRRKDEKVLVESTTSLAV